MDLRTVDLRSAAFDLLFSSVVLRPLLVNYADRLEHGHARDGVPCSNCFVALRWTVAGPTCAPGAEMLTAEAHMPRHSRSDSVYLDFVLQQVQATLTGGAARSCITARCLQTSCGVRESVVGTIFRTRTFEITPAPPRRRPRSALAGLVPWTGEVELDRAALGPIARTASLN
jgi:hypothetical protein